MRFLIDTNIVSAVMRKNPAVLRKVMQYGTASIAMSSLSVYEIYRGAWQVADTRRREILLKQIGHLPFAVLPHGESAAQLAGEIQGKLLREGFGLADMDLMLGAHALAGNLIMVTDNTKHFERIPGLLIQNWTK